MRKYIIVISLGLLVSCSTNKALVQYNTERMDRNEAYLKSMENKTVPRDGEAVKKVPLEKEAERWENNQ